MATILSRPQCVNACHIVQSYVCFLFWAASSYRACITFRADSRFATSQWETALLCNTVSHWLGANLESAMILFMMIWSLQILNLIITCDTYIRQWIIWSLHQAMGWTPNMKQSTHLKPSPPPPPTSKLLFSHSLLRHCAVCFIDILTRLPRELHTEESIWWGAVTFTGDLSKWEPSGSPKRHKCNSLTCQIYNHYINWSGFQREIANGINCELQDYWLVMDQKLYVCPETQSKPAIHLQYTISFLCF